LQAVFTALPDESIGYDNRHGLGRLPNIDLRGPRVCWCIRQSRALLPEYIVNLIAERSTSIGKI